MSEVFVTGGSGFIGENLIQELTESGHTVYALARSRESEKSVREAGAHSVYGDLSDTEVMRGAMERCDTVIHAAAKVERWGNKEDFEQVNINGTKNVLQAASEAGVDKLVYISTEAVLLSGEPLLEVDGTEPIPDKPVGMYSWSKSVAEKLVAESDSEEMSTVAVRPPVVWGPSDNTWLPELMEAVEQGRFVWINGGRHEISTCHIKNLVHGIILAAKKGSGGEVYYLTDGENIEFREFAEKLLKTQDIEPRGRSVPLSVALWIAGVFEFLWKSLSLSGYPPLTRFGVILMGQHKTADDSKAREELGYENKISVEQGMEEIPTREQQA